jgi:hypothetical protein
MNDSKSDIGGLSKSVNEHSVKIEALTSSKQGKENVQEQNSADQKKSKFAGAAVKGKGKQSKVAPPYKATVQELGSDSEQMACLASAKKVLVKPSDVQAMGAQNCNDTQERFWSSAQKILGGSFCSSAFAAMCLADDVLGGNHVKTDHLASLSQVSMTSNPLSLFSKLAALSVQQSDAGYSSSEAIITALKDNKDDK